MIVAGRVDPSRYLENLLPKQQEFVKNLMRPLAKARRPRFYVRRSCEETKSQKDSLSFPKRGVDWRRMARTPAT